MNHYKIRIQETLTKTVEIEAESELEAEQQVSDNWNNSQYVLTADNFAGVTFQAVGDNDGKELKTYFFKMTKAHHRTGERIAKTIGIIQAANEDEASEKAWELAGSDTACNLEVHEFDLTEGHAFTVYKAVI